jgi:hypothetical protein
MYGIERLEKAQRLLKVEVSATEISLALNRFVVVDHIRPAPV